MRVCFVGIGSIAKRHIRNLTEICGERKIELHIDALRRAGSGAAPVDGVERVYTSAEELPYGYDAIFLTNPTEYHAQMLLRLHEHGKHFFIEKPVTSLDTMKELENFAPREDSVYYVACPLRYTNVIQYLKKEIDPAAVRSVRSISSSYLPDWRPGTDYRNTYSAHKDLGGGVSIDLIHEWDYLVYLFGMPDEVKSFIGKVSNLEIDSDDYAIYIARYADQRIAEVHLDYFGRKSVRTVELYMDDETIVGDLIAGEVRYLKAGRTVDLRAERDVYQKRELSYFIDAISGKVPVHNSVEEAVKVLKLTQGIID